MKTTKIDIINFFSSHFESVLLILSAIIALLFLISGSLGYDQESSRYLSAASAFTGSKHGALLNGDMIGYPLLLIFSGVTILKSFIGLIFLQCIMGIFIPWFIFKALAIINIKFAQIASIVFVVSLYPYKNITNIAPQQVILFLLCLSFFLVLNYLITRKISLIIILGLVIFSMVLFNINEILIIIPFMLLFCFIRPIPWRSGVVLFLVFFTCLYGYAAVYKDITTKIYSIEFKIDSPFKELTSTMKRNFFLNFLIGARTFNNHKTIMYDPTNFEPDQNSHTITYVQNAAARSLIWPWDFDIMFGKSKVYPWGTELQLIKDNSNVLLFFTKLKKYYLNSPAQKINKNLGMKITNEQQFIDSVISEKPYTYYNLLITAFEGQYEFEKQTAIEENIGGLDTDENSSVLNTDTLLLYTGLELYKMNTDYWYIFYDKAIQFFFGYGMSYNDEANVYNNPLLVKPQLLPKENYLMSERMKFEVLTGLFKKLGRRLWMIKYISEIWTFVIKIIAVISGIIFSLYWWRKKDINIMLLLCLLIIVYQSIIITVFDLPGPKTFDPISPFIIILALGGVLSFFSYHSAITGEKND